MAKVDRKILIAVSVILFLLVAACVYQSCRATVPLQPPQKHHKKVVNDHREDFDLIEDPRDGSIKIMEINPRSPACIKASVISGIDFPNAIVDLSLNRPIKKYIYRPDKYLRYFSMDLLWLISQENKWECFKEWKKHLFSKRHFLQDGELLDPIPFVMGACAGILKELNPKFRASKKGMNQ